MGEEAPSAASTEDGAERTSVAVTSAVHEVLKAGLEHLGGPTPVVVCVGTGQSVGIDEWVDYIAPGAWPRHSVELVDWFEWSEHLALDRPLLLLAPFLNADDSKSEW